MQAALAPAGYSGTPLPGKLGLRDGMTVAFVALPATLEPLASAAEFASVDRPKRLGWHCGRPQI